MPQPVASSFRLQLPAGGATPAPPVGPVVGQHGINIQGFCQEFNDKTADLKGSGLKVTVVCSVYEDKSFSLEVKSPPASNLIKKALSLSKGSDKPHTNKVATITQAQLEEIAEQKKDDLNANDVKAAAKIIAGTARQMGIDVKN